MNYYNPYRPEVEGYRPEIDGLRALSVIAVILFHAGFEFFKGGFLGVDVFFVISGYLITTIIIKEKKQRNFNLFKFYERRARRILPAWYVVIFCCLPFAFLLMTPNSLKEFGQSLIATSTFWSNYIFWEQSNYFNPKAELNPLLHTWSLSVEEQFYIFFPIFLIVLWRFGIKWIIIFLILIFFVSLFLAQFWGNFFSKFHEINYWLWFANTNATFYFSPMRAWEIIIGVFVAFYLDHKKILIINNNNYFSGFGFILILFSFFYFSKNSPLPSIFTLIPTIGTVLILIFSTFNTFVYKLLSNKLLVYLGLMSYSAYLWHHPIFAFIKIKFPENYNTLLNLSLCSLIFCFAYISWKFIEKPFRNKYSFSTFKFLTISIITSFIMVLIGFIMYFTSGLLFLYPKDQHNLLKYSIDEYEDYVESNFSKYNNNIFGEKNDNNLLIVGDSFAQDFVNLLEEKYLLNNFFVKTIYIQDLSFCGSKDKFKYKTCFNDDSLFNQNSLILKKFIGNHLKHAKIIFFVKAWNKWDTKNLYNLIQNLDVSENQKVIVVGTKSFGKVVIKNLANKKLHEKIRYTNKIPIWSTYIFKNMKDSFDQNMYIDIQKIFCGSYETCKLFTSEGKLISYDGGHLTKDGAKFLGNQLILKSELINEIFEIEK